MRKLTVLLLILTLSIIVKANVPKGGLGGVAVSPDGKILVAGGDNRVLYIMDPGSLQVKDRIWIKTNVYSMEFNKKGTVLVVEDTSGTLYFIKSGSWQVLTTVKNAGSMTAARSADLLAGVVSRYKKSSIKLLSMTDGSRKASIEVPAMVTAVALDSAGTKLAVLADGPKDAETKKPAPKGMRGLPRESFIQQNDGKVSILAYYAIPSGEKLSERTIFYSDRRPLMRYDNDTVHIFNYKNVNVTIDGDKISFFEGKSSLNYGMGLSVDHKHFLLGGLRQGTLGKFEGMTMVPFKIEAIPGWPEYYKGFASDNNGSFYAVTTAYRLVKINKSGAVEKVVPVF